MPLIENLRAVKIPGVVPRLLERIDTGTITRPLELIEKRTMAALTTSQRTALIVGPRDAGKTVTALWVAVQLEERDWFVRYTRADMFERREQVEEALLEISTRNNWRGCSLLILDDCHRGNTPLSNFGDLLGSLPKLKNVSLLLTSRNRGRTGTPLHGLLQESEKEANSAISLLPAELAIDIANQYLSRLYSDIEPQIRVARDNAIKVLPDSNLRAIDWWFRRWFEQSNPRLDDLYPVDDDKVIDTMISVLVARTGLEFHLDAPAVRNCLLPLAAINQFEVNVDTVWLDPNNQYIPPLQQQGIIETTGSLATLQDPSEAPWLLKAAQKDGFLRINGQIVGAVSQFVNHWLQSYARHATVSALTHLVTAVGAEDPAVARQIVEASLPTRLEAPDVTEDPMLGALLMEMPRIGAQQETERVLRALTGSAERIADAQPRYALWLTRNLLAWQARNRRDVSTSLKENALAAARALLEPLMKDPEQLAITLWADEPMASTVASDFEILVRAAELHPQGSEKLDALATTERVQALPSQFNNIGFRRYIALLQSITRGARRGVLNFHLARELIPDIDEIVTRLTPASFGQIGDTHGSLFRHQQRLFWNRVSVELGSHDLLQQIVDLSTAGQVESILRGYQALQAKEFVEIEKRKTGRVDHDLVLHFCETIPAASLLRCSYHHAFGSSNIGAVSSLVDVALDLDSARVDDLVDQLIDCDIEEMMSRENAEYKAELVARLSLLIKHVYFASQDISSNASERFVCHLAANFNVVTWVNVTTKGLGELARWSDASSEDCVGELLGDITADVWIRAVVEERTPEHRFWTLWNLLVVDEGKARDVAARKEVQRALPRTLYSVGILARLGIIRTQLPEDLVPTTRRELHDASHTQCILELHALETYGRRRAIEGFERALVSNIRDALENATLSRRNRQRQTRILDQFEAVSL